MSRTGLYPEIGLLCRSSGGSPIASESSSSAGRVSALQLQLKKDDAFEWNNKYDDAFADIKHALCHAPVLALTGLNRPFEVVSDACGVGVGAVLGDR